MPQTNVNKTFNFDALSKCLNIVSKVKSYDTKENVCRAKNGQCYM
jgi:hypothetical protein